MSSLRRIPIGWTIALLVCVLLVGRSARALGGARKELARQETQLSVSQAKTREVLELRAKDQRVAAGERPPQDIVASINRALNEVGIRSDRLRGLEPVSDSPVTARGGAAGRYKRQAVAATLENLTPGEIGRFLARWRSDQPVWIPTRIELFHVRNQPRPARLYSSRIELAATYLSDEPSGAPR